MMMPPSWRTVTARGQSRSKQFDGLEHLPQTEVAKLERYMGQHQDTQVELRETNNLNAAIIQIETSKQVILHYLSQVRPPYDDEAIEQWERMLFFINGDDVYLYQGVESFRQLTDGPLTPAPDREGDPNSG
jgi:hypothetical protein